MNIINNIAVSVCISTYNHEEFIEEALNSVLEQVCNFEYEIILSNDQSTDNTHNVITRFIENHPEGSRIRYFNQPKNLGINNNLIFTLEHARGKYISLLEGDDYWVDSGKLQKQFDFMEDNKDFSICTGALKSFIPGKGLVLRKYEGNVEGVTYAFNNISIVRPNYLNMFFRKDIIDINMLKTFKYSGDNVIFIMCLAKGKGYFINQIFGYRRTHVNGLWSSKSEVERIKMGTEQYIGLYRFPDFRNVVRPFLFNSYIDLMVLEKTNENISQAFKLIRTPKEFLYFMKVIFSNFVKLKV